MTDDFPELTAEELAIAQSDPEFSSWFATLSTDSFFSFKPRPDDPANYDQQASFCFSNDILSILVGGNAAGTTEAGAFKAAQFVLAKQPPPRKDTPFWILANNYSQVGDVIWKEKMIGHGHIPKSEVRWDKISWRDLKRGHPEIVPLKPWPKGDQDKNWCLHFMSYEQGREALQAASIGGFFFSEQFPLEILTEAFRGCREYTFPGGQFAEFTPIDPQLCIWVEQAMEQPPPGWQFYRCNTAKNKKNLAAGWFDSFFGSVPDELLQTRLTGALATFAGAIYQSFNPYIHVCEFDVPRGCRHGIGTDWGQSELHPQCSVFGAEDGTGTWWIYDEYLSRDCTKILEDHARALVEQAAAHGWPIKERVFSTNRIRTLANDAEWGMNYSDPSRPGTISEFSMRGISSCPASNDVYDGINYLRGLFKVNVHTGQPKIFIHKRCRNLIEQLRKYRWQPMRGKGLGMGQAAPRPVPLKMDDDLPDCLRYLVYSRRMRPSITPSDAAKPKSSRVGVTPPTDSGRSVQFRKKP